MNWENIKELAKRFWPFILIIVLVIVATWYLKPGASIPISNQPEQVIVHKYDSLKYAQMMADSVKKMNELRNQLRMISGTISVLRRDQFQRLDVIDHLIPDSVIRIWNLKTGDQAEIKKDSSVITKLSPIRTAVKLITMKEQGEIRELNYLRKDSISSLLIIAQDNMIKIKDDRIGNLTKEFYQGQAIQAKLNDDLEKANKKVRRRNIIIGVTAGAAAAGVLFGVLK